MNNTTASRRAFEEWAKQNSYDVDMRGNQKAYPFAATQCAWEKWQADAASLLPAAPVQQEGDL